MTQPVHERIRGQKATLAPGLFRYVMAVSGRHQLALLALSVSVFLLSAVPLEIQRRVVNGAFHNGELTPILWLALAYFGVALTQGGIKLGLNVYRSWVSEVAVLDLRRLVSQLTAGATRHGEKEQAAGTEISMIVSEVEPIGGFVGVSISEPVMQAGILLSVFGYLLFLQPLLALLCLAAFSPQLVFVPMMQRAINRRAGERIRTLRSVGGNIVGAQASGSPSAMALGAGGYFVVQGRIEVGTVVAFVSGLDKVNDPWRDLVSWFREMTLAQTRYRLLTRAFDWIAKGGAADAVLAPAKR